MRLQDEADFRRYVTDRSYALRRTAYLMCGDWHQAEDLVQTAFLKLYKSWRKVEREQSRDAYVRQIIVRALIDEQRRGWRRERSFAAFPDDIAAADVVGTSSGVVDVAAIDAGHAVEERDALLQAMAQIPARQRATLVLRYWEDQSIEQAAHALGCSRGTVKSQTARGLAALRAALLASGATTGEGTN